jgi:23S rRNA U2552 (ribose-2'-O)-methylase RlmE/FtsJ
MGVIVFEGTFVGWTQVAARQLRIKPEKPTSDTPIDLAGSGNQESGVISPPRRSSRPPSVLIAVDLLSMAPIPGVHIIQGDFTLPRTQHHVVEIADHGVDVVLSDMCANVTGELEFMRCHASY